jgi:hypothetical protein
MSFFQGSPLPNITETTTKDLRAPDYYTNYLTGLSQAGQTALGKTAAEGIAGYDPLQTTGYGQMETAAGAYQPGLTAAGQTAAKSARGIDTSRIGALMDPYTQSVVDEMARLQQQNIQRNLLPTMKGAFVGSGGLGSQRYAGALGQSLADAQASLTGQQYGALSAGYQNALKAALDEAQLQNLAAKTQADIAGQEQILGLRGAGALTQAGAERQKYEQAKLDYPLSTATNVSGLLRNFQVPISGTETKVGPGQQGQYGLSPFQTTSGILSLVGGAAGPAGANAGLQTIANRAGEFLGGLFQQGTSSSGSSTPTFTFTNPSPLPQFDASGTQIGTTYFFG